MERRLAAILAADVVGYSRLMGMDEAGTLDRLKAIRKDLVAPEIARHKGRIVKLMGDGLLAEFASVVEAVACAVAVQTAMPARNADIPKGQEVLLRIGINLGDVIIDGRDIYGDGVNVAARLEGLAEPGGICVSDTVHQNVRSKLDLPFDDLGNQQLKNIAEPVHAFRIVLGTAKTWGRTAESQQPPLPDKPSIAVLPFDNMSGDPEQEFFSDGIAEDIITELSRFHSLFVIARNSSFSFKGQVIDVKDIGQRLGVAYVLEGSVRKAGGRIRVTAQLIEAATGSHVWAERYDRDLEDIFDVQDEVVGSIVTSLEPQIGSFERQRARRKPAENMDAWECLQRGLWHLYGSMGQNDELDKAVTFIERAVTLDPAFATAHAGLAYTLYYRWLFGYTPDPEGDKARALAAARTAVSLDPEDGFGHVAMCRVHIMLAQHEAAIADAEAAIRLNPSYATAYFGHAHALWHAGRPEEAIVSHDMAIRLSPRDPLMWAFLASKSIALMLLGRYEESLEVARSAQRQPGAALYANIAELAALGSLGDKAQAAEALVRAKTIKPDLSIAFIKLSLPIGVPDVQERFLGALRLAGVPD